MINLNKIKPSKSIVRKTKEKQIWYGFDWDVIILNVYTSQYMVYCVFVVKPLRFYFYWIKKFDGKDFKSIIKFLFWMNSVYFLNSLWWIPNNFLYGIIWNSFPKSIPQFQSVCNLRFNWESTVLILRKRYVAGIAERGYQHKGIPLREGLFMFNEGLSREAQTSFCLYCSWI